MTHVHTSSPKGLGLDSRSSVGPMNTDEPINGQQLIADLHANGGGTYEAVSLAPFSPTEGYAIGIGGPTFRLQDIDGASLAIVLRDLAATAGTGYVGTWLDSGTVYLDAVVYTTDPRTAARTAYEHKQKALYDFGSGLSLRPGQVAYDQ